MDSVTSRTNDARALRSRAALRLALLEWVEKKPFEQIPIREITNAAGVSYPTFFRNYGSKEDLLCDVAADEVRQLLALMVSLLDKKDAQLSSAAVCGYVEGHRTLWKTLFTTSAASIMREEFIKLAKEVTQERGQINTALPLELSTPFFVSGIFEILAWWLRQDDEYPSWRVSQFLEVLVMRPATSRLKLRAPPSAWPD